MARRAFGSVILRLTTSAYLLASSGSMAIPKPAATKPGIAAGVVTPRSGYAGEKPAALQKSSVTLADRVPLLERHERFIRHLLQSDPPAPREPMGVRHNENELLIRHTASSRSHRGREEPPQKQGPAPLVGAALRSRRCCSGGQLRTAGWRMPNRRTSSGIYLAPSVRRKPSEISPRSASLRSASSRRPLSISPSACSTRARKPLAGRRQADRTAGAPEQLHAQIGL